MNCIFVSNITTPITVFSQNLGDMTINHCNTPPVYNIIIIWLCFSSSSSVPSSIFRHSPLRTMISPQGTAVVSSQKEQHNGEHNVKIITKQLVLLLYLPENYSRIRSTTFRQECQMCECPTQVGTASGPKVAMCSGCRRLGAFLSAFPPREAAASGELCGKKNRKL